MKLSKAIEVGQENIKAKPPGMNHNYFDALALLIQAGKEIEQIRLTGKPHYLELLPGETKE